MIVPLLRSYMITMQFHCYKDLALTELNKTTQLYNYKDLAPMELFIRKEYEQQNNRKYH